jgi:hypothetical protein
MFPDDLPSVLVFAQSEKGGVSEVPGDGVGLHAFVEQNHKDFGSHIRFIRYLAASLKQTHAL